MHLSLLLLPPLHPFFVYLLPPPVAPVVTRRPPVRLTGGRCHAAPGVLPSVPMFGGLPLRPVRLTVPRTTVLVPIPSLPTGKYFRGHPARPLPVGPPWPQTRRPPKTLSGPRSMSTLPIPFPCSWSGHTLTLKGILRRHGRGPRDPVTALVNRGDRGRRSQ